jgi:peptidoglycan/xylan/chitin deacetylase (PgdA/CDA1 family)
MAGGAVWRLQRAAVGFRKRFSRRGVILMYHRVAQKNLDPWSLCVTPDHFAKHMEALQKHANPMSLRELVQAHHEGRIPDRAVVVTFDDGYADNLHRAKPILERFSTPATVFVISGCIGKNQEFWWDELEQILLRPYRLPETLNLGINGNRHEWTLGTAVDYTAEDHRRDANRTVWEAEPGSRLFFYYSVWQKLQPLTDEQRRHALDEIIAWAEVKPAARTTQRPVTFEEAIRLEEGALLEVGAHTVTHPFLSAHPLSLQRDEIRQSKADLEDVLGHTVTSFSYPHGNYTAETVSLVREAGFSCACNTVSGNIWRNADLFQLPRFEVRNWGGEEFERGLSKWFRL